MPRHDPHSYADLAQGRLRHLSFQLQADFGRHRLSGTAHYHLERPVAGPFDLDARDLEIQAVSDAAGRPLPHSLGTADPILGSRLRLADLAGANEFKIAFTTGPRAHALQWLTPAQTAGQRQPYLFTQCQPHHARTLFPCQDTPSVRFTYEAELRLPAPLQ
ncbi:MAG TPA: hypothetical protein VK449_10895, partial [Anaerolineales bacterium]|nr:hypothetical protein [Anaerolineales bacterium]